ncbi:MAG: Ku protein [Burkholderiales bacterium]
MSRAIWKGAISFGLVHVPVALYSASSESEIDFDWLDKRSMDPVGYKRINKRTGKDIGKENIVKGVKIESDDYVVLSEDDIRAAYPKTTQTIDIEAFVEAREISFAQFERPYFLEPIAKGAKVYALLREAMLDAGVIGIARVVMHTKEHLAALVPTGPALILNTLRWANEIRSLDELKLPAAGAAQLKGSELKMAGQLIRDMTRAWKPGEYEDRFSESVMALVRKRVKSGKTTPVRALEAGEAAPASNVVDLTALLKQSLSKGRYTDSSIATGKHRSSGSRRS